MTDLERLKAVAHAALTEIVKERDQLKAENEELRKDAERLNWLTAQGEIAEPGQGDVRRFIDEAMSKEANHEQGL